MRGRKERAEFFFPAELASPLRRRTDLCLQTSNDRNGTKSWLRQSSKRKISPLFATRFL
jgi:hypothetical protein